MSRFVPDVDIGVSENAQCDLCHSEVECVTVDSTLFEFDVCLDCLAALMNRLIRP